MPHNRGVLPHTLLSATLDDLPFGLTPDSPLTWLIAGAALALVALFALKRVRRLVLLVAIGTAGAAWAWSSGIITIPG